MGVPTILQPQPTAPVSSSPAFLSRFPRSLSSLSLGGKRKSVEKENANNNPPIMTSLQQQHQTELLSPHSAAAAAAMYAHQAHSHNLSIAASVKNKFAGSTKDLKQSGNNTNDHPPPLPQRNFMRSSQTTSTFLTDPDHEVIFRKNTQISDLDNSFTASISPSLNNDHTNSGGSNSSSAKVKKRNKVKVKANSDPKISTHLFIQMEKGEAMNPNKKIVCETGLSVGNKPPPLPPRQPGMIEENPNLVNKYGSSGGGGAIGKRPPPNSLDTLMNYPLIATCTAIKDNNLADADGGTQPNNSKHMHHFSNTKSTVSNSTSSLYLSYTLSFFHCLSHTIFYHDVNFSLKYRQ